MKRIERDPARARPRTRTGLSVLGCLPFALAASPALAQDLVITNVQVVDMRTGEVLRDRMLSVADGLITGIAATAPADAAQVVDGGGAWVIPGLLDMHAHVRANGMPDWITTDWMMPLLLAHGVTGVRDMASTCPQTEDCLAKMRDWQRRIETGELIGPRLLALSSFPLNSPRGGRTEADWRALIRGFHESGLDLVKVYYRLTPAEFGWIMDEANALGIEAGGHIPLQVTMAEASAAGLRSIEHARDVMFDCWPGAAEFRAATTSQNPSVEQLRAMVDDHDPARCDTIFRTLAANDTWYVPTHVTRRMDAFAHDSAFRADPRARYLPPMLWESWNQDADRMAALAPDADGRDAIRGFYETGLDATGRAHRAGVGVLMGTDGGDSFSFPGSAAHDELGELVRAGLSPLDALRAATIRPAEFLRIDDRFGTTAAGRTADFLLLDANPLEDIDNVRRIRAVVFRGEYLDRARLDELLHLAERTARRPLGGGP